MITHRQVLAAYASAIAESSAIAGWCQNRYGQPLHVQVGEDGSNPPEGPWPMVVLTPGTSPSTEGEDNVQFSLQVEIDWIIEDAEISETANIKAYEGVYRCDDLGRLIFDELRAMTSSVDLSQVSYSVVATAAYPLFAGGMTVVLEYPNLIGGEVTFP